VHCHPKIREARIGPKTELSKVIRFVPGPTNASSNQAQVGNAPDGFTVNSEAQSPPTTPFRTLRHQPQA